MEDLEFVEELMNLDYFDERIYEKAETYRELYELTNISIEIFGEFSLTYYDDKLKLAAIRIKAKYPIDIRPIPDETLNIIEWLLDADRLAKKPDTDEGIITERKDKVWDDENKDYILISKAVEYAKQQNRKISVSTLSKTLTPAGQMRYMRKYNKEGKPYKCKVHFGDFSEYINDLPKIDASIDDFSTETLEDFDKRKEDIKNKKIAEKRIPNVNKNLNKFIGLLNPADE